MNFSLKGDCVKQSKISNDMITVIFTMARVKIVNILLGVSQPLNQISYTNLFWFECRGLVLTKDGNFGYLNVGVI